MLRTLAAYLISLAVLVPVAVAQDKVITGKPIITDADTLVIDGEKIRLHGMDAPEMRQICFTAGQPFACGVVARDQLKLIASPPAARILFA